jgi:hypothetical protein
LFRFGKLSREKVPGDLSRRDVSKLRAWNEIQSRDYDRFYNGEKKESARFR